MLSKLVLATVFLLGATTCQVHAQQINLSPTQIKRLGIDTQAADKATSLNLATIPGKITAPLDAQIAITVPFGGTVYSLDVLEGAPATKGQTLLSIASSDYLAARSELAHLEAEYRMTRSIADRLRKLATEGIASEARAEEAETHVIQAKASLSAIRNRLAQTASIPGREDIYRLISQNNATVASLSVKPGEPIDTLETAIILQAGKKVWLEATLPAALATKVHSGDKVTVSPGNQQGTVIAVGLNIDPKSRSVILRAELDSSDGMRPGQNVLAIVNSQAPAGALIVPRSALVRLAGENIVFASQNDGFKVIAVNVLSRGRNSATITAPLAVGDHIATSGLIELKALAQQDN